MAKLTAEQRFWAKVTKTDECWLWTGCLARGGYGHFWNGTRQVGAHRYAYELLVGPIPEGMQLDHRLTCPKRCVNPAHLRPATNKQNQENRQVLGVYLANGYWRAEVKHNRVRHYAGYFPRKELAIQAAARLRNELYTHNDADRVWPYVAVPGASR
jgi:hypothetical protein